MLYVRSNDSAKLAVYNHNHNSKHAVFMIHG